MAEQVRKDVAVFIDFENIYVSVRDKLDTNPNFEIIMDRCNELGRVILARAYADWYRYPRITSALYANNIEPMYVPTYYYDKDAGRTGRPIKNSVDMNLCIEAMRTLFTMPGLSTFVLITGDRDFIPLVNSIRQQGKDVIIIGVGGAASSHLAQSADEFIFYEHLIGKQIATAPTSAANRRYSEIDEFERPGRDRVPAAVQRAGRTDTLKPAKADHKDKETAGMTEDVIWELLAKAVVEARARSIVPSVGSLKTLIRELSNGEFREQMVHDANGRPLERFRDVVQEAANRGKLIISTDSIVNEIFLPGEDPRTLSSFNVPMEKPPERAEEPLPSVQSAAIESRVPAASANNDKSRRRRRNDRDNKRSAQPSTPAAVVNGTSEVVPAIVDEYAITPQEDPAFVAPAVSASTNADTPPQTNGVPFSDDERQMVRDIVANSERALSFQQIYDVLRSTRNRGGEQLIPRTNEELRSLVKSIINAGELQRIGRGNRVSYRMAQVKTPKGGAVTAPSERGADTRDDEADASHPNDAPDAPVLPSIAAMVPTPDDMHDLDDGLSLPLPTAVPTVAVSTPSKKSSASKPKKKTNRQSDATNATMERSSKGPQNARASVPAPAADVGLTPPDAVKPVTAKSASTKSASAKSTSTKSTSTKSTSTKSTSAKSTSTNPTPAKSATSKSATPKATAGKESAVRPAAAQTPSPVPSPSDAPVSAPKPRRRTQTPER